MPLILISSYRSKTPQPLSSPRDRDILFNRFPIPNSQPHTWTALFCLSLAKPTQVVLPTLEASPSVAPARLRLRGLRRATRITITSFTSTSLAKQSLAMTVTQLTTATDSTFSSQIAATCRCHTSHL